MDARFATHEGIYTILQRADDLPGLLDVRVGEWLAWPAAKTYVYSRLFAALFVSDDFQASGPRVLRTDHALRRLRRAFAHLRAALDALPARGTRARIAWLVSTHPSVGPDGIVRDSIVDDVPRALSAHADQIWFAAPVGAAEAGGIAATTVHDAANTLAAALEPLQRLRPSVRKAAADMARRLRALSPDAGGESWSRLLVEALSAFEAHRLAWNRVFRAVRPSVLLVTDAAYHVGEVAAAREAGVRVAEFQHGLFGPRCPEYGWPRGLAESKRRVPVADRLFVFGDLFRDAALHNGFWQPEQIRVIGSGALHRHRAALADAARDRSVPRVLFFTQLISRGDALKFWNAYLTEMTQGRVRSCAVTIKVHPEERRDGGVYDVLAARFADRCTVVSWDAEPLALTRAHDVVVSYTSNALIEAVGLGVPAVSLSGTHVPAGVFGLCPIPGAAAMIPTVTTPLELDRIIADLTAGRDVSSSRGFYADHAAGTALAACLELLTV